MSGSLAVSGFPDDRCSTATITNKVRNAGACAQGPAGNNAPMHRRRSQAQQVGQPAAELHWPALHKPSKQFIYFALHWK